MVRLKDIAERCAVSIMTVSKALRDAPDVSETTKARVKLLAKQMGYVPDTTAQGLRTRTTKILGLAISSLTNPVFSRVVLAIEEHAAAHGYEVLLAHTLNQPEREELCLRRFLARRVDGILVSPVYRMASEAPVYKEILQRGVPTVVLGHSAPFCDRFPNVEADDLLASYAVTRHLLKLGHRRIAFLAGPLATPWNQERFEGYRRALRESGLEVDDRLVFQAGRSIDEGRKAALQLLQEGPDATAIQAVNDVVAVGCADVLLSHGIRIPEDVSVTGFGNTLVSEFFRVPLTTVKQPKYRLGQAAVEVMLQLLHGKKAEPRRLPAPLNPRASSGPPPSAPRLTRNIQAA